MWKVWKLEISRLQVKTVTTTPAQEEQEETNGFKCDAEKLQSHLASPNSAQVMTENTQNYY